MLKVATFFKEERDPLYQRGEAKGIERGIEKGIEKGLEEGVQNKSYEVVRNLLLSGRFTVAEIAFFAGVTEELVFKIKAESNF